MPKKLKTFVTQVGFYELAVAAPSMKAALEAWGITRNVFQQGFAEESDDPEIIAATIEQPGTVLKRAVGTKGNFKENAELPRNLPANVPPKREPLKTKPAKITLKPARETGKAAKTAILSFEKAKAARDKQRATEEAARKRQGAADARQQERRSQAVKKAVMLRDQARKRYEKNIDKLEHERQVAEDRVEAEHDRWKREKDALDDGVRKAGKRSDL